MIHNCTFDAKTIQTIGFNMNEQSNNRLNGDMFFMESRNHSDTELVEKQLQQALQELKLSQEERSHLLLALERSSEEQDALDEELEKKNCSYKKKKKNWKM